MYAIIGVICSYMRGFHLAYNYFVRYKSVDLKG